MHSILYSMGVVFWLAGLIDEGQRVVIQLLADTHSLALLFSLTFMFIGM